MSLMTKKKQHPGKEAEPGQTVAEPGTDGEAGTETADTRGDKPVFYTSNGRIVYGGGGITPDLEFEPLYYTELQRNLERKTLAFKFAVEVMNEDEIAENFKTTDDVLNRFYGYLEEQEFEYKEEDLTEENVDYIRTMIAREAVSYKYGRRPMYRVLLDADPEFQEVLRIFGTMGTLDEMFSYAEEQKSIKKASVE